MELSESTLQKIQELEKKYQSIGQDLDSYLDGLLYANPIRYWDYIKVDTLLSLQQPETDFPDEEIFIMYHQITELYFKLVLHEMDQLSKNGKKISESGQDLGYNDQLDIQLFIDRLKRINNYFKALTSSFGIMIQGMEKEQFLKFRMSLLPASGFQSAQYRLIEIAATDLINIVQKDHRDELKNRPIEDQLEYLYWKKGATELETGKKTLTLLQFEKKYMDTFLEYAENYENSNLWKQYKTIDSNHEKHSELKKEMRELDVNVNINWPLVHYKSAVRYLQQKEDVPATGGTNWQKYLPPRFQKRIFYPELWSDQEKEEWGKKWVEQVLAESIK